MLGLYALVARQSLTQQVWGRPLVWAVPVLRAPIALQAQLSTSAAHQAGLHLRLVLHSVMSVLLGLCVLETRQCHCLARLADTVRLVPQCQHLALPALSLSQRDLLTQAHANRAYLVCIVLTDTSLATAARGIYAGSVLACRTRRTKQLRSFREAVCSITLQSMLPVVHD